MSIPVIHEQWLPCYRLIPSCFPPIDLFEDVADPADLEAVFYIEMMTNPRLRQETGELNLVPVEDRVSGSGTTPIMAAFTHLNPEGSRFSEGSYGIYYAGRSRETAIKETVYRREQFLSASDESPMELDMRLYCADLNGEFHDIRGEIDAHPEWYDPDNYSHSQKLGNELHSAKSWGVLYKSVRHPDGECVGVFRPPVLSNCRQGSHYGYIWDGNSITDVYEKKTIDL